MSSPGLRVPRTRMLDYFLTPMFKGAQGPPTKWCPKYVAEAERWLAAPDELAAMFDDSVESVEAEYRNYQPFRPREAPFRVWADTKIPHGESLCGTVDVAARLAPIGSIPGALASKKEWQVEGGPGLTFRYIDREIVATRARPKPVPPNPAGWPLRLDLFLANTISRRPILCELKLKNDACAFYALIQLLTQAAYFASRSQRERLVLFGSQPDFILAEATADEPAKLDLYLLLVHPPKDACHTKVLKASMKLSQKLMREPRLRRTIGKIAWIEGECDGESRLRLYTPPRHVCG